MSEGARCCPHQLGFFRELQSVFCLGCACVFGVLRKRGRKAGTGARACVRCGLCGICICIGKDVVG
jgi:hypothetical protein